MVLGKGFGCWNTMPTSRRSATGSMPFENTETPSSRMSPAWRVCGISSFSRFTERRKVLLPQPDGPIRAVTARRGGTGVRTPGRPLSSEPPRNVRLGLLFRRLGEQLLGAAELDQVTQIKEAGVVGDARGLLQVVRHDYDRVAGLELVAQLVDMLRAGRIQRRCPLVER